ncbi:hypothetical protein BaRGS_00030087 [Batillaria attramentaria]|uniref:C1q domain-containing protein n=1 Tax=Batillaria attramentaria TaxID=370345 RepID=A0ABD0JUG5_9CAEN
MNRTFLKAFVLLASMLCVWASEPLPLTRQQLTEKVESLEKRLADLESARAAKVAFRTYLKLGTSVSVNHPIQFTPLQSIGGGYNQYSGIFTVPYNGWYALHFFLLTKSPVNYYFDVKRNDQVLARAFCNHAAVGQIHTCASSDVRHLKAGDKVWVQSSYGSSLYHGASYDNSFSGFLVYQD